MIAVLLALIATSRADDRHDVHLSWIEPTCDQVALRGAVAARAQSLCGPVRPEHLTFQYQATSNPLGCEVWVHGWCPDGKPVSYQPPGHVTVPTLFTDAEYKGTALPIDAGPWELVRVPLREGGDWKQKAGSVRVPAGWTLRLCSEAGGAGRCSDFTGDTVKLSEVYVGNDAAAYALVGKGPLPPAYPCPRAFEHDGFGGKYLEMCNDVGDFAGSSWNDAINSVIVPAGWALDLCANARGEGACASLTGDARSLSGTIVGTDKTSSVVIRARPK